MAYFTNNLKNEIKADLKNFIESNVDLTYTNLEDCVTNSEVEACSKADREYSISIYFGSKSYTFDPNDFVWEIDNPAI